MFSVVRVIVVNAGMYVAGVVGRLSSGLAKGSMLSVCKASSLCKAVSCQWCQCARSCACKAVSGCKVCQVIFEQGCRRVQCCQCARGHLWARLPVFHGVSVTVHPCAWLPVVVRSTRSSLCKVVRARCCQCARGHLLSLIHT